MGGATIGAIAGSGSGQTAGGMAIGAAAGAAIGGIVGIMQDAKENKEQERIAQERAYQQEIAKMREMDARTRASREQELAIAEGMRITSRELEEAEFRAREAEGRLKELRGEVEGAMNRTKTLTEAADRKEKADAEIRLLEEQLRHLKEQQEKYD